MQIRIALSLLSFCERLKSQSLFLQTGDANEQEDYVRYESDFYNVFGVFANAVVLLRHHSCRTLFHGSAG